MLRRWALAALALASVATVPGCTGEQGHAADPVSGEIPDMVLTGLDHIPVAVIDLEQGEQRFRALGFTLKPGRHHDNGIRNAHAKFADTGYLELITAAEATDALTTAYRRHLKAGDGPAYLAFGVSDVGATAAALQAYGDRVETGSGFVAFAETDPLATYFFGMSGPSPTDRPEHFVHANSARSLESVWIAPDDADAVEAMLGRLGARFETARACLERCGEARIATLGDQRLVIVETERQRVPGRPIIGATIRVASLDRARQAMAAGGLSEADITVDDDRILVSPAVANGLWLEFHEATR